MLAVNFLQNAHAVKVSAIRRIALGSSQLQVEGVVDRYRFWAVFFLSVGFVVALFLQEVVQYFQGLGLAAGAAADLARAIVYANAVAAVALYALSFDSEF